MLLICRSILIFIPFTALWNSWKWNVIQQIKKSWPKGKWVSRRMPFSRRPTSRSLIESQTLTIWPWYDLDLRQVKLSLTDVQVAKLPLSMRWPWPWPIDLDTQTWPRYGQDVTSYQKWSFYVNLFKSYSPNRHTDTTETLPLPHTREVKMKKWTS